MEIDAEKAAAAVTYQGQAYHFCSAMFKPKFSMNPAKFASQTQTQTHDHAHHGHNH